MTRFLVLSATLLFSVQAWAGGIAVVDFQRAVNETNEGKAAQAKLDGMFAARKGEIDKKQAELEAEFKDFESRAMILSESARAEAQQTLIQKQGAFQQLYMQYEGEMQQTYMTLLQDLDQKMRTISEKVAREKGYDLVIDRAAVVYMGGATVDMTDDLVKRYNAGN
ncbi:MAG: OmpH family outer membrane protein [Alphaproteobacteria bacterium]|nr:OmpH family outer membrane protein [Alphaproteobacteria bacterium]